MRPLDQLAEIAQAAVTLGADILTKTPPKKVSEKSDRDIFTDVDVLIERTVRSYLAEVTPDIAFTGEEEGGDDSGAQDTYLWALDPIDGTANFAHGIPLCAVQIALHRGDETLVSAITIPHLGFQYWAGHRLGAYANGSRLGPPKEFPLSRSIVSIGDYATGEDAETKNVARISITAALAREVERVRLFGSAAVDLAWTSEGRTQAAVILSNNLLDVAPGVLLAREAGLAVLDRNGEEYEAGSASVIAAAPNIAEAIVELTQGDCKSV